MKCGFYWARLHQHTSENVAFRWSTGKNAALRHHPFACGFELTCSLGVEEGDQAHRYQSPGCWTSNQGHWLWPPAGWWEKRSICFLIGSTQRLNPLFLPGKPGTLCSQCSSVPRKKTIPDEDRSYSFLLILSILSVHQTRLWEDWVDSVLFRPITELTYRTAPWH